MSIDDTFRWIADMPSVMLPPEDQGVFPDLDDSVTVAIQSPELKPSNPDASKESPQNSRMFHGLASLSLESQIPNIEPTPKFRSFTPLSSIPSLTDDVSEASTPRSLRPDRLAKLSALVRDALESSPDAPPSAIGSTAIGSPLDPPLNASLNSPLAPSLESPLARPHARIPHFDTVGTPAIMESRAELSRGPPIVGPKPRNSHYAPLPSRNSSSWLDNLQTSPIDELPPNLLTPPGSAFAPLTPSVWSVLRKLTDEDWQTIHALCSYLDRYPAEPVDQDTYLNICDVEEAAKRLKIPLPLPMAITEAMVHIGCQIPRPASRSNQAVWLSTAHACERSFQEREHEKYELERLHEQQNIAAALNIKLVQRRFLKLWRQAWFVEVYRPRLAAAELQKHIALPKFVKLWRLKLRKSTLQFQTAEDINTSTTLAAAVELWRARANNELQQRVQSRELDPQILLQTTVQHWRQQLRLTTSLHHKAQDNWSHHLQQKYLHAWHKRYQLNKAQKLHTKAVLRTAVQHWRSECLQITKQAHEATVFYSQSQINRWRRRTAECQRVRDLSVSVQFTRPLMRLYLQRWRNEHYVLRLRHDFDAQHRSVLVANWRQATQAQILANQRLYRRKLAVVHFWRRRLAELQAGARATDDVVTAGNLAGAKLCLQVWRKRGQKQRIRLATSIELDACLLQRTYWRHLWNQFQTNRAAEVAATTIDWRRTLTVFCRVWYHQFAVQREQRLAALKRHTETMLARDLCRRRLRQWQQYARHERRQRELVPALLKQSNMRLILRRWHAQSRAQPVERARAVHYYAISTRRACVQRWRQRLNDAQTMYLAADDLDIARLALRMRSVTQKWQLRTADLLTQRARAANYRQTQLRRFQLAILNRWREKLGSAASPRISFYESPTKLAAVSPQLISKLRLRNESTPRPNSRFSAKVTPRAANPPFTPTKPSRPYVANALASTPARPPPR